MKVPSVTLNDGAKIPQIGFGMWQLEDESGCEQAVRWALKAGYTHFDTAQYYENEQCLGNVLAEDGVPRDSVFITTKIANDNFGEGLLVPSFEESLRKLQTDHVDLLLLHFPVTAQRQQAWAQLEKLHKTGKAKSIGVSNYTVRHLEELLKNCKVKPAVNQVELHVFLQQAELRAYCKQHDIRLEAYSPLVHGQNMDNPVLRAIAEKHGKTVAQIMLRWCLEQDLIPLPKSAHEERIKQNIDVLNFELDQADLKQIEQLNNNYRTCWDPTDVE
jgi:diketogulonate reductase-like aldo/keto reductase